ncbi:glycosyl transferase family 28 [Methylobacterium sp. WL12]|uniref:glycosyltransferase n=1 Tax=Methylobacterium sp. WL12 TaxID=2603890 RepID=UPI0011C91F96|nr:glycosyltransferase [Methylobacterium sp. WL12]TXM75214.1 glycosyl transferase family 28 [Methylobacterium sp. WL12]
MRVLIAVTHLLGAGHLTRAAAIGRAFAAAGHAVTLASGGDPAPIVRLDGLRHVQLPPLHVNGTAFTKLLGPDGQEAGVDLLAARRARLRQALDEAAPDVVVTELFPFGRRALAAEYLDLVEAAAARRPRPLILASIRDVLVAPAKPEKVRTAHAQIAALYDAVLVHGDPALLPLDASWPVDAGLRPKLRYTGYVDEAAEPVEAGRTRSGILVSAGSSAAGLDLCRAAADAARQRPDLGWRILAGNGIAQAAFDAVGAELADGVLTRAVPNYRPLLARAAVSVSACGYNTAVDLLATRTPSVLVPFAAGAETEQSLRAAHLATRAIARVVPESALSAAALIDAVEAVGGAPSPTAQGIDLGGAKRTVAIVEALFVARGRVTRAKKSPFDYLRAILDDGGENGRAVSIWWRDDDAVAATPALDRLLALAESVAAPLLVAAIPAGVAPSLGARLADTERVSLAVHGLAHANHAAPGGKPSEFGADRSLPVVIADAAEGLRLARDRLPADRLLPVFVPPWNRLAPDLAAALPALGYRGLSSVPASAVPGLVRADVMLDPIDWRGTRSLVDPERLVDTLCRAITEEASGPIGLLTHHLAHDAAIWDFLDALMALLARHEAVAIRDPRQLFQPSAVDEVASACWTQAADAPARIA